MIECNSELCIRQAVVLIVIPGHLPRNYLKGSVLMIYVSRLNKKEYILNCELIETIEATPDTILTLRDGKKHVVMESPEEIVNKIIEYKRRIFCNPSIINNGQL